ncbi:MAG: type II secretion system F family protein [Armatimonadota bacterium]|nr:MAG: type II secretion system F family protein [Armatimonadota bacterium]
MLLIISALTFVAVSLMVTSAMRPRLAAVRERIDDYMLPQQEAYHGHPWLETGFGSRVLLPALRALGKTVSGFTPSGALEKIRRKLDMAGNPRHIGVIEYIGLKALAVALAVVAGILLLRFAPFEGLLLWAVTAVAVAVGFWLPDIVLQRIIETRQSAIRRALPDVLDLLVVSVEAGVGFDGAMQKVVEKSGGPLPQELGRVLEQVRLGKSRADALREMGQRTQVPDLVSFVAAVQQAELLGVSIAKVLRVQADAARERRSQRAREAAAKLPVKLLFPLVFFIFPALFVVILGPGAIRFAELFKVLGK